MLGITAEKAEATRQTVKNNRYLRVFLLCNSIRNLDLISKFNGILIYITIIFKDLKPAGIEKIVFYSTLSTKISENFITA